MSGPRVHTPTRWLIGILCVTNVAIGWTDGYRAIAGYLAFWVLAALALLTARRIVRHVWRGDDDPATGVIRIAVIALALIVGCGLLLGAARLLTLQAYVIAEALLFAASRLILSERESPRADGRLPDAPSMPAAVVGVLGALTAFAVVFASTHAPMTLYDSVSYHLFFSA